MDEKLKQIQKLLDVAEGNLHSARNLLRDLTGGSGAPTINPEEKAKDLNIIEEGKIIEGVYNGENMVGPDGKEFPVPPNYASKSKLVEGDVLKLTIADDGSFIFKQINPIDRKKALGTLVYDGGNYTVKAEGKTYKVLQASVTYYKGEPGDQVSVIIPRDHESTWAAVENIMKAGEGITAAEETNTPEIVTPPTETTTEEISTVTPDVPAEETEDTESGPSIEFPPPQIDTESNAVPEIDLELKEEDKKILESLTTPEAAPSEPTITPEVTPSTLDEPGDEGIKELEI